MYGTSSCDVNFLWVPWWYPKRLHAKSLHLKLFIAVSHGSIAYLRQKQIQIKNHCNLSLEMIFYLFLNFRKSSSLWKIHWFLICIYFGFRYAMDPCDTAIKSLRCKVFAGKRFGYHHGTQRKLTSHEEVPCKCCGPVYIIITRSVWGILGTMIVPKIFLFEKVTSKLSESGSGIILSNLDDF